MRLTRRFRRNNHSDLASRIRASIVDPHPKPVVKLRLTRVAVPGPSQGTRLRHRSAGVQYNGDAAAETEGTLGENSHVEDNDTNTVEDTSDSGVAFMNVSKTSVSATTTSIQEGTTVPHLAPAQFLSLQRKHSHAGLVLIFVGGALGATLLVLITTLVLRRRRRMQGKRLLDKILSRRWFKPDEEKSDVVVSIHVPPPTVPLKSILLPSPTSPLKCADKLRSDPASLTSTQLSVIINGLPKAHLPDSEDSSVSQVSISGDDETPERRAARVGPSPSDFLARVLGRSGSFSSSNSASSRIQRPEAASRRSGTLQQYQYELPVPPLNTYSRGANNISAPMLPRSFRVPSGPRGHGLVLTGDQHISSSSFAQWRYERSLVREEALDVPGFSRLN